MESSLSKIKQPAPSVAQEQKPKYKVIQNHNIGVLEVPKISKTPIRDSLELKRQENPRMKYKLSEKQYKLAGFQTNASIAVVLCGIASLFKLFKK